MLDTHNFSPGDTVVCINSDKSGGTLTSGKTYIIDYIKPTAYSLYGCRIHIKGIHNYSGFYPSRFKLVPKPIYRRPTC